MQGNRLRRDGKLPASVLLLAIVLLGISPTLGDRGNQAVVSAQQHVLGAAGDPPVAPPPAAAPPVVPPPGATSPKAPHRPPTDAELDQLLKSGFASEIKVDRVVVPAIVVDKKGRPVQGLKAEDFRLTEDLIPQKIDFFHVDRAAQISIAFLLDVSGSMRLLDKIGEAREAVGYFIDSLNPKDQVQLMTFADDQVDTVAPFGTDQQVVRAFLYSLKAYGQTALNDAIAAAPGIVSADRQGRKAIVLITDGIDNFSRTSLREAVVSARRTEVPFYAIGFAGDPAALKVESAEAGTNAEILRRVAEETGGAYFLIHDPDELKEAIRTIEEDLRSQYVLGYVPPRVSCDGSFRTIKIKIEKGDRYQVRTRKGYFSGPC